MLDDLVQTTKRALRELPNRTIFTKSCNHTLEQCAQRTTADVIPRIPFPHCAYSWYLICKWCFFTTLYPMGTFYQNFTSFTNIITIMNSVKCQRGRLKSSVF